MPATATYLYCVVRSGNRLSVARVPHGVPGGDRPQLVALGRQLWLVVSQVPVDLYGAEKLDSALRDLERVSAIAAGHEAVVEHFTRVAAAAVVPMKLFTLFSSAERAVKEMQARRAEIAAVLKRIAGCEEWGVRVTRLPSHVEGSSRVSRTFASGAEFLTAKKAVRDQAHEIARQAARAAEDAFFALAAVSRESRRRDDVPSAAAPPPLLEAAFLVAARSRARFHGAARRVARACASAGAEMIVSGPWPAYNFIQPGAETRR